MPHFRLSRLATAGAVLAAAAMPTGPALAQAAMDHSGADYAAHGAMEGPMDHPMHGSMDHPAPPPPGWGAPPAPPAMGPAPEERMAWLAECRRRIAPRDVTYDAWGNEWSGHRHHRHGGHGAAPVVEAPRGDECERYLSEYYAYYAAVARGYPGQPGYGCCQMGMMMMPRPAQPECREEVRYVTEYVTVPGRRIIPRRPVPDKRIRIAPDKRVRTN